MSASVLEYMLEKGYLGVNDRLPELDGKSLLYSAIDAQMEMLAMRLVDNAETDVNPREEGRFSTKFILRNCYMYDLLHKQSGVRS